MMNSVQGFVEMTTMCDENELRQSKLPKKEARENSGR